MTESLVGKLKLVYDLRGCFVDRQTGNESQTGNDRQLVECDEGEKTPNNACPLLVHFSVHMLYMRDEIFPAGRSKERSPYLLGPLREQIYERSTQDYHPGAVWVQKPPHNSTNRTEIHLSEDKPDKVELRLLYAWINQAKLWWTEDEQAPSEDVEASSEDEDRRDITRWRDFFKDSKKRLNIAADDGDEKQTLAYFFGICFQKKYLEEVELDNGKKSRKRTRKRARERK